MATEISHYYFKTRDMKHRLFEQQHYLMQNFMLIPYLKSVFHLKAPFLRFLRAKSYFFSYLCVLILATEIIHYYLNTIKIPIGAVQKLFPIVWRHIGTAPMHMKQKKLAEYLKHFFLYRNVFFVSYWFKIVMVYHEKSQFWGITDVE